MSRHGNGRCFGLSKRTWVRWAHRVDGRDETINEIRGAEHNKKTKKMEAERTNGETPDALVFPNGIVNGPDLPHLTNIMKNQEFNFSSQLFILSDSHTKTTR